MRLLTNCRVLCGDHTFKTTKFVPFQGGSEAYEAIPTLMNEKAQVRSMPARQLCPRFSCSRALFLFLHSSFNSDWQRRVAPVRRPRCACFVVRHKAGSNPRTPCLLPSLPLLMSINHGFVLPPWSISMCSHNLPSNAGARRRRSSWRGPQPARAASAGGQQRSLRTG